MLIIAAHPDDEVLAMGGTIARFKALNARVKVQFLGEACLHDLNVILANKNFWSKAKFERMVRGPPLIV